MRFLATLLLCLAFACASGPPPTDLVDVQKQLDNPHTAELEHIYPRLIADARSYALQASRAHSSGDEHQARLLSLLARQSYDIVDHLAAESSARKRHDILEQSVARLDQEEARVQQELDELRFFSQTTEELQALSGDLASADQVLRAELENALREIERARTLQLEAIALGAPSASAERYHQGAILLAQAVVSLSEFDSFKATTVALEAAQLFSLAMADSRDSDVALRRELLATQGGMRTPEALKERADEIIHDAQMAKASALTSGGYTSDPQTYEHATRLLESAHQYAKDQQYELAIRRAHEARDLFTHGKKAVAQTNTQPPPQGSPEKNPIDTNGAQPTITVTSAGDTLANARTLIQNAEDQRFELTGLGLASDPRIAQGDYALGLAKEALQNKEPERAEKRARDALALFESLAAENNLTTTASNPETTTTSEPKSTEVVVVEPPTPKPDDIEAILGQDPPLPREPTTATRPRARSNSSSSELDALAKRLVLELQLERAAAIGEGTDARCPQAFREFETLMELAQSRLDMDDTATAFELAIRAEERFKKCTSTAAVTTTTTTKKSSSRRSAAQADGNTETRATRKAREQAASALSQAQESHAMLKKRAAGHDSLSQAAELIALADTWYNRKDYGESTKLSERASTVLKSLKTEIEANKDEEARIAKARDGAARSIADAQTQMATATRTTTPNDKRLAEAKTLLESAESWFERKSYDEASQQAKKAVTILGGVIKKPLKPKKKGAQDVAASTKDPKKDPPKTCKELSTLIEQAAIARARVEVSKLDLIGEQRFQRAVVHLEQARGLAERECDIAVLLASDARAAFGELAAEEPKTRPTAKDPTTQPETSPSQRDPEQHKARAEEAIAHAEVKLAQIEHLANSKLYQTGTELLERAKDRLDDKEYPEAQKLAEQAAFAFDSLGESGNEAWREPYNAVIDALILRDEAEQLVGDGGDARFDKGQEHLERARRAWDKGEYLGAERFAREAARQFQKVVDDVALQRKARAKRKADRDAAALQAKRDAENQQSEADREAAERQAKLDAEAKAKADADAKALADAKAKRDAEQRERERVQAESELREAEILAELCAKENCESRDAAAFTRAERELADARRYLQEENYDMTTRLAVSAAGEYQTALDNKPAFVVPDDLVHVRIEKSGHVILEPRLAFLPHKSALTPEALKSVDEFANLLKSNEDIDFRVQLVGYTDTSGVAESNLKLSSARAEACRQALIERGIPSRKLYAEGRGEADPIATNETPEGREANRRVEILLTLPKDSE